MIDVGLVATFSTPILIIAGASWRFAATKFYENSQALGRIEGLIIKADNRITNLEINQAKLDSRLEGIILGRQFWTPPADSK